MLTLKRHLNISDMGILLVYALSELVWSITYEWHGGVFACKTVAFLRVAVFNLSSYIVVAIAVNRALSLHTRLHCLGALLRFHHHPFPRGREKGL